MKLWVLKYKIGDTNIYLTPDNCHSIHIKDAIKFQSEENCKSYKGENKTFLDFEPSLEEIPESRLSYLQE